MPNKRDMNHYLSGRTLYGDDFSSEEINEWVEEEEKAYFDLTRSYDEYVYAYNALNFHYGFRYLADMTFNHALAFGCARGDDVKPIAERVARFTAMEPAEKFWSNFIGQTPIQYVKPERSGDIPFADNAFDLVACLGVLHHIPNVSHVLGEFHRVLAPDGILLMREPISSMGDWRKERPGLTKRERGLPVDYVDRILSDLSFTILQKKFCVFPVTVRLALLLREQYPFNNKFFVILDSILSGLFRFNLHYHRDNIWKKIAPSSVFLIAQKQTALEPTPTDASE